MRRQIFTLGLLWCSLLVAPSQPATGESSASFAKELLPLWDLTGTYHAIEGGVISELTLSHAANGRLSLTGTSRYDDDVANTHVTGTASGMGRVTGTLARGTKGFVRAVGYVSGTVDGEFRTATGRGRETFVVDSVGNQLIESAITRTCVQGGKCSVSMGGQGFAFGTNGSWQVTTTLSATGNKLEGSALLRLANGRVFNFTVRGRYSPRTELSTVKLVGTGESIGANVTATIRGSDKAFVRVRGVLLGQRLNWSL
jgi:hypothetical protein